MKLLLYLWGANNEEVLRKNLIKSGHEIITFSQKCMNYTRDIDLAQKMIMKINEVHAEGVISFNYFPIISMVCDATKTTYYSWVYDCPHFTLYAKTLSLPCNRIGIFDKAMVDALKIRGINTVFHLPLAASAEEFDEAIAKNRKKLVSDGEYKYDVSFVGSLYTDEHNYFDMLYPNEVPASVTSYIEKYSGQYNLTPSYEDIAEDDLVDAAVAMSNLGLTLGEDYNDEPLDVLMPSVFEKKLTIIERDRLLHKIAADQSIRFGLYTGSKTDIKNYGTCGYSDMMPCVFNASRINLNISLRSIHSGVPLRVMDIMAAGGFLLSNYQPEIAELFKEDKEVVLFRSLEEAITKIKYYLEHEDERLSISLAGKRAVAERCGYRDLLGQLLG